eukprot:GHVU01223891.1.p1 GENE.GHVU01223891.1~~GHVU01223891.1.p1  ORF type:complete len:643 (-),score=58.46 GHVU01223891.1:3775-5703(-)
MRWRQRWTVGATLSTKCSILLLIVLAAAAVATAAGAEISYAVGPVLGFLGRAVVAESTARAKLNILRDRFGRSGVGSTSKAETRAAAKSPATTERYNSCDGDEDDEDGNGSSSRSAEAQQLPIDGLNSSALVSGRSALNRVSISSRKDDVFSLYYGPRYTKASVYVGLQQPKRCSSMSEIVRIRHHRYVLDRVREYAGRHLPFVSELTRASFYHTVNQCEGARDQREDRQCNSFSFCDITDGTGRPGFLCCSRILPPLPDPGQNGNDDKPDMTDAGNWNTAQLAYEGMNKGKLEEGKIPQGVQVTWVTHRLEIMNATMEFPFERFDAAWAVEEDMGTECAQDFGCTYGKEHLRRDSVTAVGIWSYGRILLIYSWESPLSIDEEPCDMISSVQPLSSQCDRDDLYNWLPYILVHWAMHYIEEKREELRSAIAISPSSADRLYVSKLNVPNVAMNLAMWRVRGLLGNSVCGTSEVTCLPTSRWADIKGVDVCYDWEENKVITNYSRYPICAPDWLPLANSVTTASKWHNISEAAVFLGYSGAVVCTEVVMNSGIWSIGDTFDEDALFEVWNQSDHRESLVNNNYRSLGAWVQGPIAVVVACTEQEGVKPSGVCFPSSSAARCLLRPPRALLGFLVTVLLFRRFA